MLINRITKNIIFKISLLLLFAIGLANLHAQTASISAGGNASGNGGSVSYSVGQIDYAVNTNSSGAVSQGVQQIFAISVVTGIEETRAISLSCSVYPNPTTELLSLSIEITDSSDLFYQLYDISGRLLETEKIGCVLTTIDMRHLSSATYFLKVTDNNKEIKIFKIIKN